MGLHFYYKYNQETTSSKGKLSLFGDCCAERGRIFLSPVSQVLARVLRSEHEEGDRNFSELCSKASLGWVQSATVLTLSGTLDLPIVPHGAWIMQCFLAPYFQNPWSTCRTFQGLVAATELCVFPLFIFSPSLAPTLSHFSPGAPSGLSLHLLLIQRVHDSFTMVSASASQKNFFFLSLCTFRKTINPKSLGNKIHYL